MNRRPFTIAWTLIAAGLVAAIAYGFNSPTSSADPSLPPFEFHREGAASPEDAAKALFRGVATASPKHFVRGEPPAGAGHEAAWMGPSAAQVQPANGTVVLPIAQQWAHREQLIEGQFSMEDVPSREGVLALEFCRRDRPCRDDGRGDTGCVSVERSHHGGEKLVC